MNLINKVRQIALSGRGSINFQAGRDINLIATDYPTELVDEKISSELSKISKSRFFSDFSTFDSTIAFSRRLIDGNLSRGSSSIRSVALAWCARLLSLTTEHKRAAECVAIAKSFATSVEVTIAEAFLISRNGDKDNALKILFELATPASRSAAFIITTNQDGGESALDWLQRTGWTFSHLDGDGKYFMLAQLLEYSRYADAAVLSEELSETDFGSTPALHHAVAMAAFLPTVPKEFRSIAAKQVPFNAADFRLSDDAISLEKRRRARRHFEQGALEANRLDCRRAANAQLEFALWLELRDPNTRDSGISKLTTHLGSESSTLRLVPLALQFGVQVDVVALEDEIDRHIAQNGKVTADASIARLAIALTQETPKSVAEYISRHFNALCDQLDRKSLMFLQIEMLSRAGLTEQAITVMLDVRRVGLSEEEATRLETIISESKGNDPIELRKKQYERSKSLTDLLALIESLADAKHWNKAAEFGLILFEQTRSIHDADRLVTAMIQAHMHHGIMQFLEPNHDLLEQSPTLQFSYAWALYNAGFPLQARRELERIDEKHRDRKASALQLQIAIGIGDWNALFWLSNKGFLRRFSGSLGGIGEIGFEIGF